MSNRLLNLVWGAKPLGCAASCASTRLVMASLADNVNEVNGHTWCFPSLETIQARTELSRSAVQRAIRVLSQSGWLRIERRQGYGNVYHLNEEKLAGHQRERRYRPQADTSVTVTPVSAEGPGGVSLTREGCQKPLPNKEEPEVNQQQPESILPMRAAVKVGFENTPALLDWVSPQAWSGFVAMRAESGKPLTPQATAAALGKLARLREEGHDPNLVLEESTLHGWYGLFGNPTTKVAPLQAGNQGGPPRRLSAAEERQQRSQENIRMAGVRRYGMAARKDQEAGPSPPRCLQGAGVRPPFYTGE